MAMNVPHILRTYQTTDYSDLFDTTDEYHRWLKDLYKRWMCYAYHDPLAHSMMDGIAYQRFHKTSDTSFVLYGFLDEDYVYEALYETEGETDRERLANWFDDRMYVNICSDHDCTGRAFTRSICWHVNPSGLVSFVHSMEFDV